MIGNFKYSNPTKLYFGDDSLKFLADELKNQGSTVMLSYGGGSIKRNGIYDQVVEVLKQQGKKNCRRRRCYVQSYGRKTQ